jgi:Class III cytochrome C family
MNKMAFKLFDISVVAGLCLVLLAGCDPTPKEKLAVGNIYNVSVFGALDRQPVGFDHDKHSDTLGSESCKDCHHVLNEETKKLEYVKGEEKACQECHGAVAEGNVVALDDAYHNSCIGCHETRTAKSEKAGPQACNSCHASQEFATWVEPVTFEHSRHMPILERNQSCDSCHHVFDEELQKPVYAKGQEAACSTCHPAAMLGLPGEEPMNWGELPEKDRAKTVRRLAVHQACLGCHRSEIEAGHKAGPINCSGCHDPQHYPPLPEPIEPGQLKFEKKDVTMIARADSIMPGVPFDHKLHQEKTPDCISCHNQHVMASADHVENPMLANAACDMCHQQALGDASEAARMHLAAGLNPDATYHDEDSPVSCVGCHKALDSKGPKTAAPCSACHTGEAGLEAMLQGRPAPVEEEVVWPEKGPVVYIIDHIPGELAPVHYNHKKHQQMLINCDTCHHYVTPEMAKTPACNVCHADRLDPEKPNKPGLVGSYHQMCLGCHAQMGSGPVACEKCHEPQTGVQP